MATKTRLRQLADNAKKIDIQKIVSEEIKADESFLVKINQLQLQESKDSKGRALGFYKSRSYAKMKGRKTIDLFLTGAFYKGFFIRIIKGSLVFNSKDSKTKKLTKRFGNDIFGLNSKNQNSFIKNVLLPRCQDRIRKLLHV